MATGYTIFVTYKFEDTPAEESTSYGHASALHCTEYQTLTTDTLNGKSLGLYFGTEEGLQFLADTTSTDGTGFTATKIIGLVQIVDQIADSGTTVSPTSDAPRLSSFAVAAVKATST